MKKIISIQNLIYSVALFLPLYLVRFSIFGFPTNILEILIYLAFVLFLLEKSKIDWIKLYRDYKIYVFSILLIFAGLVLSTLINQNYREGFGIIKGWLFDPLLLAFMIISSIKNQKEIENILKAFYISSFFVGLIGIIYFFAGHLTFDSRLSAFYSSPNYLAMFLAPAIFTGIFLTQNEKIKIKNDNSKLKNTLIYYSLIIFFLVISLNLYLTFSYATWVSIFLSLLIIFIIQKKWKLVLIMLVIILLAFLTQLNSPKLNNIFNPRSSLESRLMIWQSAEKILEDHWIFGIGPGNFQNKYLEYQKYFPPYLEWAVPQPHNLYLAFWLQSGILGIVGFLILAVFWIKNMILQMKSQKNSFSTLAAVLLAIMLCILIHGFFDTPYWKNDLSVIFWIVFSLGLILKNKVPFRGIP